MQRGDSEQLPCFNLPRPKVDCFLARIAFISAQVELWLEELHDRRVQTTARFEARLRELQALLDDTSDLIEQLEELIAAKKAALSGKRALGSSVTSCDQLIKETVILQSEAQEIGEQCQKAVCSAQSQSSTENSVRAYSVLDRSAEYSAMLDARLALLTRSADFFQAAQNTTYRMDQMELQVRNADHMHGDNVGGASNGTREFLQDVLKELDEMVDVVCGKADEIIAEIGGHPSDEATLGVRNAAAAIRSRADNIRTLAGLKQSQSSRGGEAVKSFDRKLEELEIWIESTVVAFLRANRHFGDSHGASKAFLESHRDLVNRIHMKTFELEGLRGALRTVAEQCSNEETKRVEARMDDCNRRLSALMVRITQRLAISEVYAKFLKLYEQTCREMEQLEAVFSTPDHSVDKRDYDESRMLIQQLSLQVGQLGKNVIADLKSSKGDDDLDKKASICLIEDCTTTLNTKQTRMIGLWKDLDVQAREGKRLDEEWSRLSTEKRESVHFSMRIDGELFPVVRPSDVDRPDAVCAQLEERLAGLPRQKVITERFAHLVTRVEEMKPRLQQQAEKRAEADRMLAELRQKQNSLRVRVCRTFCVNTRYASECKQR